MKSFDQKFLYTGKGARDWCEMGEKTRVYAAAVVTPPHKKMAAW